MTFLSLTIQIEAGISKIANASPLLVKAIAVTTIGTGTYTAATGVSDMWEAGQDIGHGLSGSNRHSVNLIKDKVFKGNEGAYRTSQFVAATVSTAGTAYLAPIARGLQATNSGRGATAGVKEGAPKTNPIENIKYTDKVKAQMKQGDYHSFQKV